jgi:hypothetical protein
MGKCFTRNCDVILHASVPKAPALEDCMTSSNVPRSSRALPASLSTTSCCTTRNTLCLNMLQGDIYLRHILMFLAGVKIIFLGEGRT